MPDSLLPWLGFIGSLCIILAGALSVKWLDGTLYSDTMKHIFVDIAPALSATFTGIVGSVLFLIFRFDGKAQLTKTQRVGIGIGLVLFSFMCAVCTIGIVVWIEAPVVLAAGLCGPVCFLGPRYLEGVIEKYVRDKLAQNSGSAPTPNVGGQDASPV